MIEIPHSVIDVTLLRQALSLSLLTGKSFRVTGCRELLAGRPEAVPFIDDWKRVLDEIGAGSFTWEKERMDFTPNRLAHGNFTLVTGPFSSAVETALMLMPALLFGEYRSRISVKGVTHAELSPSTDAVRETLLGLLERTGIFCSFSLKRFGFYGTGGGSIEAKVYPAELFEADLTEGREPAVLEGARVYVSRLPAGTAHELKILLSKKLNLEENRIGILEVMASDGPGQVVQTYLRKGSTLVIFSETVDAVDHNAETVYSEEKAVWGIDKITADTKNFIERNVLPLKLRRELSFYGLIAKTAGKKIKLPVEPVPSIKELEVFLG